MHLFCPHVEEISLLYLVILCSVYEPNTIIEKCCFHTALTDTYTPKKQNGRRKESGERTTHRSHEKIRSGRNGAAVTNNQLILAASMSCISGGAGIFRVIL